MKHSKLSIKKIVSLAFALCILICAKYKFGLNIDGIEIVTSLFVMFSLMFNLGEMLILAISFNMLVLVIYGFGYWWIAYWYIWPLIIILFNIFHKYITKNNITFALFCGLMGVLMILFFFINDLIFMGKIFAIAQLMSALPVNLIEGATNCIFAALAYYPFLKLINKINVTRNVKILSFCPTLQFESENELKK